MTVLEEMIESSEMVFLRGLKFEEVSPGRHFSQKIDLGNGWTQFYVVLGPNAESPVHNHAGENMEETHVLQYGAGSFFIYDGTGEISRVIILKKGEPHEIFSTPSETPNHKYVAGPKGSITIALEHHYAGE